MLKNRVAELELLVKYYEEQFGLLKKRQYGASSEKSIYDQLAMDGIFNEAEATAKGEGKEPDLETVKEHRRRKRTRGDSFPEDLLIEEVLCELPGENRLCPGCGSQMHVLGHESRDEIVFVPASLKIRRHLICVYACRECEKSSDHVPILKARAPEPVIKGSFASPEAVAHIAVQKYVMGSPLYRQEQEWERKGAFISRQTMANWIIRCAETWLLPIWLELKRQLLLREVLHADETTLQVLKEPGKKAQSKSYIWNYRTSGDAEDPIILMEYRPNRKAANPEAFLTGFSGYLHVDGYEGYHNLGGHIVIVGCWAHARRKWDEALKIIPESAREDTPALVGKRYCDRLFAIERDIAGLSAQKRHAHRLSLSKPLMDEFFSWAAGIRATPKSAVGKAIGYMLSQQKYLRNVLLDGRLELSNNRAERSIKPFVICRKNFLFANTPGGAAASAVFCSLIETAKETGVDPFGYLAHVFRTAPGTDMEAPENVRALTPAAYKRISSVT